MALLDPSLELILLIALSLPESDLAHLLQVHRSLFIHPPASLTAPSSR
jgi:hypothetical protein